LNKILKNQTLFILQQVHTAYINHACWHR